MIRVHRADRGASVQVDARCIQSLARRDLAARVEIGGNPTAQVGSGRVLDADAAPPSPRSSRSAGSTQWRTRRTTQGSASCSHRRRNPFPRHVRRRCPRHSRAPPTRSRCCPPHLLGPHRVPGTLASGKRSRPRSPPRALASAAFPSSIHLGESPAPSAGKSSPSTPTHGMWAMTSLVAPLAAAPSGRLPTANAIELAARATNLKRKSASLIP